MVEWTLAGVTSYMQPTVTQVLLKQTDHWSVCTRSDLQLYLDILDEVGSAVSHLLGCLDKVLLCHRIAGLAGGLLTSITQHTGVFGNHCGCS